MTSARLGCLLFCMALSSACALLKSADIVSPALLSISPTILGERTVEQRLVIRWSDEERSLEAVLEIAEGRLRLALMSFGMRISTLEYNGRTLEETRNLPQAPSGARMINDLLLIAAPQAALQAALPEGWKVTESETQREISQDGKTQVRIRYAADTPWRGRVIFEHLALNYQLILDSHEF